MIQKEENRLTVSMLCEIANVSRSGYYNWVASKKNRDLKEEQEQEEEAVEWQVTNAHYPQPDNPITIDCPTLNIERAGANLFETITTRDGSLTLRATPYENHLEDSIRYWTTGRYNSGANGE